MTAWGPESSPSGCRVGVSTSRPYQTQEGSTWGDVPTPGRPRGPGRGQRGKGASLSISLPGSASVSLVILSIFVSLQLSLSPSCYLWCVPVSVSPLGLCFSSLCDSLPPSPRRGPSEPRPGLTKARGPILGLPGPSSPGRAGGPGLPLMLPPLSPVCPSVSVSMCLGLAHSGRAALTRCAPCCYPWPCCWPWPSPAPCSS